MCLCDMERLSKIKCTIIGSLQSRRFLIKHPQLPMHLCNYETLLASNAWMAQET